MFKAFKSTLGVMAGIIFVCFILLIVVIGSANRGQEPTKVGSTNQTTAEKFKVGDKIQFDGYVIQVSAIENPFVPANEFVRAKDGFKYVAVDVSYENQTGTDASYNTLDWKMFDSEGYNYTGWSLGAKEPTLSSGNLAAGAKVRGWLTFEVPNNSQGYKVQFSPSFWSNRNVEIQL